MTKAEQQIATSVLVIGTGGSGLRAAIELAEQGIGVLVVGKRPKTGCTAPTASAETLSSNCWSTARSSVKPQPSTRLHSTPNNVPIQRFPLPETRSTMSCPPMVQRTSGSCNERSATP